MPIAAKDAFGRAERLFGPCFFANVILAGKGVVRVADCMGQHSANVTGKRTVGKVVRMEVGSGAVEVAKGGGGGHFGVAFCGVG